MPSVPTPSKAGIIETQTGERHIPSSLRADGTKRKEIKIRPGYKPPEDVEVYKNRTAETWKNRGSGGVPGAEDKRAIQMEVEARRDKNAKRREARKKAKAGEDGDDVAKGSESKDWREGKKDVDVEKKEEIDPEVEREKKARNLKKKLKQAKDLKEKSQQDGAKLLPEQFAKVIKINELIRELDLLGFDSDGEPKGKDGEAKVEGEDQDEVAKEVAGQVEAASSDTKE